MKYTEPTVSMAKAIGSCGLKSSEIKLENGKLSGALYVCNGNRQIRSIPLRQANCQERKSQDGKYNLYVCYPGAGPDLFTLAFPVSSAARNSGYILIQEVGDTEAAAINEMSCGPERVKPWMAPKPGQQDVKLQPSEAMT
jgi:hypothetical protein